MRTVFVVLLSFGFYFSTAQSIDSTGIKSIISDAIDLQKTFNPQKALSSLQEILPKANELLGSNSNESGIIHYNIASCHLDLAQYPEAKEALGKALNIFELLDSVSIELGDTYMLLGIYYDYMGEYNKALNYYSLTKNIYSKILKEDDYRFGYLYNNMGICIFFKGDIQRALAFFNKALGVVMENSGISNKYISSYYTNSSICYSSLGELNLALRNISLSFELGKQNSILNTPRGARIYHSLAISQLETLEYDKSLSNIKIALRLRENFLNNNHTELGTSYEMLGTIYFKKNELISSKNMYKKALKIFSTNFKKNHPKKANIFTQLSKIYLQENQLAKALDQINKSLSIFDYDENIPIDQDKYFDLQILEALELKAKIHFKLWKQTKNILQLKKSFKIYQDLIFILNKFRQGFKEASSKEILASDFFYIFEGAIEVCYFLHQATNEGHYLHKAFQIAEYSTSFVLLENIRNTNAKKLTGIPDSLIQLEYQLKLDITSLEKERRNEEFNANIDHDKIMVLSGQIFDLKERLYNLIKIFEEDYPNYFRLKYDIHTVNIDRLQGEILDQDQTLVEYFVGDQNIFVFIISKNHFEVKKIKKNFPLEKQIADLRTSIIQYQLPFNLPSDYHDKLINNAEAMFYKLVFPIEEHLSERLVIIPGGALAEIPFEVFIKEKGSHSAAYKEHWYLLNDYAISYCYSATLLEEMISHRKENAQHKTIAFAPNFSNFGQSGNLRDLVLLPLNHNIPEAKQVASIMNGTTILGLEATEEFFLKSYDKFSILHFASHAKANNKNGDFGFLAFSEIYDTLENELLFVKDVYNLPIKSEMATLSACETGIGERRKGEGIISLARGFSFAGTGSINTSLWKVNDEKMSTLMASFYQNIESGKTKDQAMRQAKLDLINSNSFHADTHPFYWTSMISIGDMRSIIVPSKPNFLLIFCLLVSLIGLGWWLKNKKSPSPQYR